MPLLRRESWTRIWVIPFGNLLGIALLVLMALPPIIFAAFISYGAKPSTGWRPALGLLLPAALIAAAVIDCRWRLSQPSMTPLKRWFSPYEGATFVVFPIWVCALFLFLSSLAPLLRMFK